MDSAAPNGQPKPSPVEKFSGLMNLILSSVPENDRPDMSSLIEFFKDKVNPSSTNFVSSHKDRLQFSFFNLASLEWAYDNWTPRKDDILLIAYPKTGTTWILNILRQILYANNPEMMKLAKLLDHPVFAYMEFGNESKYELLDKIPLKPRIIVTHSEPDLINMKKFLEVGVKMVQCYRNPKDTMVSFLHMVRNSVSLARRQQYPENLPDEWDTFFTAIRNGKLPNAMKEGEWYPHWLQRWNVYSKYNNFHRLSYEDLKQNTLLQVNNLAKFLEVDLTEDQAKSIIEKTSFGSMKNNKSDPRNAFNFFRKGDVGDWTNYFTDEQSALVDQDVDKILKDTDIKFVYKL